MKTRKSTTPDLTNCAPGNWPIDASPDRGFITKRFILALLLMGSSLTVFLWGAGGISYGDSPRSAPLKAAATPTPSPAASAQFYDTFGTPNSALVTDGYVLVSVTGETTPCPTITPSPAHPPGGSQTQPPTGPRSPTPTPTETPENFTTGVQFFRPFDFSTPCGGKKIINFKTPPPVQHIDG